MYQDEFSSLAQCIDTVSSLKTQKLIHGKSESVVQIKFMPESSALRI